MLAGVFPLFFRLGLHPPLPIQGLSLIIVEVVALSRGGYVPHVDGAPVSGRTETPLLTAARWALKQGAAPSTPIAMRRKGADGWDLRSTVGRAASLTVVENARTGPRFAPYREAPQHLINRAT